MTKPTEEIKEVTYVVTEKELDAYLGQLQTMKLTAQEHQFIVERWQTLKKNIYKD